MLLLVKSFEHKRDDPQDQQVQDILESTRHKPPLLDISNDLEALKDLELDTESSSSGSDDGLGDVAVADADVVVSEEDANAAATEPAAVAVAVAAAHTSLPRLTGKLAKAYSTWETSVLDTLKSIQDWYRRSQEPVGNNDEISFLHELVVGQNEDGDDDGDEVSKESGHALFAVVWKDASKYIGRRVRIDGSNRVVYAPPRMFGKEVAETDFSMCDVLITHAGACNRRFAGTLRDSLPEPVVRFLRFCKLCVHHLNQAPESVGLRCVEACT